MGDQTPFVSFGLSGATPYRYYRTCGETPYLVFNQVNPGPGGGTTQMATLSDKVSGGNLYPPPSVIRAGNLFPPTSVIRGGRTMVGRRHDRKKIGGYVLL